MGKRSSALALVQYHVFTMSKIPILYVSLSYSCAAYILYFLFFSVSTNIQQRIAGKIAQFKHFLISDLAKVHTLTLVNNPIAFTSSGALALAGPLHKPVCIRLKIGAFRSLKKKNAYLGKN